MDNNEEEVKDLFCKPTDERALLSFCFKNIEHYYTLSSKITENDFLSREHSNLFTILGAIHKQGVNSFDLPFVVAVAKEMREIEKVGGVDYLRSISSMLVSERNFDVYLNNVLQASTKYKLFNIVQDHMGLIAENSKDGLEASELIGAVETKILDLSTESKAIREPINLGDTIRSTLESRRNNKIEMIGLSTGYPILDKQIDGLIPGTLNIVAARLKMGKSSLLSNIAAHVAYRSGVSVLYIDTEMPYDQWGDRIIAGISGIDERIIKHGGYTDEVYNTLIERCVRIVEKGKMWHEFMPGYTIEKVVALVKKFYIKHKIGLLVFDYIKEPDLSSNVNQRKEYQLLGDVTTKLKDIAGELNIPVLAAVQINRDGEIADSDRIARYADVISFWSPREKKEIEEFPAGGSYKLWIKDSRRGGSTPKEGLGYHFFRAKLAIKEVDISDQMLKDSLMKGVMNAYTSDEIQ
jgi:replicative DNA helicase